MTRAAIRIKPKPAPMADAGKSVPALGDPQGWHWSYYRSQVQWRGRYRLFHVARRHQADAAALAAQHDLALVAIAPDIHELRPLESARKNGAMVGPRRFR